MLKNFISRKKRVRSKIFGTKKVPRLSVWRSNKSMTAQIIDDEAQKTLVGMSTISLKKKGEKLTKLGLARALGQEIAKKAEKIKITKVVFDRGGFPYKGRIKEVAEGAREGGLKF